MYFLEAILITVPTSLVLLAGYRRAVSRSMRQVGAGIARPLVAAKTELQADNRALMHSSDGTPTESVTATKRRLVLVYGLASLVAAFLMAFLFALSMKFDLSLLGAFVSWYSYAWPVVPITVILLALPQHRNILFLLLYLLLGAVLVGGWSWFSSSILGHVDTSPLKNTRYFLQFLGQVFWLPYLIILVTGNRRLRPVSPLVMAGLLVFSFGSLFARDLYLAALQANPKAAWLLFGGSRAYALWYLVAALPIGYGCWVGLRQLASWYERKRFSDVQLVIDSWWLIVSFQFSSQLASDFGWAGLAGLLAFVGYRGTVELGLRVFRLPRGHRGPTLLLLRVFGFQHRTEVLFDSVAERWRFVGPVMMIAGGDLAMRTVNPGDVISFVSGRLSSRFIADEEQGRQATAAIDGLQDPDGRYRTTKFFCREDTWRHTLTMLLEGSDLVLMDLRGFSESNSGCSFELQELIAQELLARTLLVVDHTTNKSLLEETIRQQARSCGKADAEPLQVRHLARQSSTELAALYESLQRLIGHGSMP
ncbi:hypothetical protein YTPLAS18_29570 [Nitrospira sp.]|nr:hypothetical protein YTPLAS18_29570 [Nitrospira sp.]